MRPGTESSQADTTGKGDSRCCTMCPGRLLISGMWKRGFMRTYAAGYLLLSALVLGATAAGAPAAQDQDQNPSYDQPQDQAYQNFSAEELDNLLASVALYPDPLLAQVLVAATFPDQIDEAARYLRAGADPNSIDDQPWDVSVKAVAHYPTVLYMMDNRLDWTTSVGQAYVYQSTDVQASIQRLRAQAHNAGTLVSGPQIEVVQQGPYWNIWPVNPQVIYVPVYDPAFVYFGRPGWRGPYITFGVGFPIGAWLSCDWDWGGRGIYYFGWGSGLRPWAVRSRPYVHITNVYVNNRYREVRVNRDVIRRPVNYENLNRYNAVHRDVNFSNHQQRSFQGNAARPSGPPPNQIVQRNINVGDSRIQDFRGREGSGPRMTMEGQGNTTSQQPNRGPDVHPAPQRPVEGPGRPTPQEPARSPDVRPAPQRPVNRPNPPQQPAARPSGGSAYNVERGPFSPGQSSARGQSSVQQMNRPAPAPRSAPASPPAHAQRPAGGRGKP